MNHGIVPREEFLYHRRLLESLRYAEYSVSRRDYQGHPPRIRFAHVCTLASETRPEYKPLNDVLREQAARIAVNSRFKSQTITGVQRYGWEVSRRLKTHVHEITPKRVLGQMESHAWEQFRLPLQCGSDLLWSPGGTGPLQRRKQVVTIHDMSPIDGPQWFSAGFGGWYRWLLPRLARRAQHVIAVSDYTRKRVIAIAGVPPEKVTTIALGADEAFSPRPQNECIEARQRFLIQTKHYLLSLCSLQPRKNLRRLLNVWKEIHTSIPPDWTLVLAGGKGMSEVFAAEHLLADLPRIVFTGYVEDMMLPALISGASAFIYPSLYEGFGLPVLEAMCCGVPVISSNATSMPEVTGDDAALLVSPLDSVAIGKAILMLVDNPDLRARMGNAGMHQARQFSWDRCAAETESILLRETLVAEHLATNTAA
jgi:glycosyltransferase involved in cell wall biosynthesis